MERRGSRLSRRAFVVGAAGLGLVAGCGLLPGRQPSPTAVKVYRLGFLSGSTPAAQALRLDILLQALGELGYVEGQNLVVEYRWGDGDNAPLVEAAAELARLPVDAFVVSSVAAARLAREVTTTVPIVLAGATGDPIGTGLAASYARPGGNVTGVSNLAGELGGKRLQLLKEAVPSISQVAFLRDAETPVPSGAAALRRDALAVGLLLRPMAVYGPEEFDAAFEAAAREGADALLVTPSPLSNAHRAQIVELAARHRWPAMYSRRQFVDEGGLMAYDASPTDLWRRTAAHVDKILRGANPADIPIEQPMTFEFVVNMKTAQALGITFTNEIMLQVTEVIQ
jgi:putative ABC transport system substrate-binding protein